jgi:hemerythrin
MTQQNLKWDEKYSLGISNIDEQHKHLFDIVSKIYSLQESKDVKNNIKAILLELFDYIKVHFKDEEKFMASIHYPELAHHHELHQQLSKAVSAILTDPSRLDVIQTKMRIIAKQALIDHILEEDIKFQQFYLEMQKKQSVQAKNIDETIIELNV